MKKIILFVFLSLGLVAGNLDKDNTIGIEINPVSIASAGTFISGGVSYFYHDSGVEIAMPFFYYSNGEEEEYYSKNNSYEKEDKYQQFNIDLHYRQYHDGVIGGLYYGGLVRYIFLDGKLKDEHMNAKVSKVGLAGEIGYKTFGLFGYKQLYWGASFSVGAYLTDKYDQFQEPMPGDSIALVDVEFFKFGVTF